MSKFCGHCGSTLADNATFCPNCGAPAVDQAMPQQQFNQPQQFSQPQQPFGGQPAFQPAMPGAAKKGMSKGAKTAIFCAIGAVALGLIIWLIIALVGGGYEKTIKNHLKSYEKADYELFSETLTAGGAFSSISGSSVPSASSFSNRVTDLKNTYGDDFSISYSIVEKTKVDTTQYLGLVDEVYTVKLEITISGSKKSRTSNKTCRVIKVDGKWCLSGAMF